MLLIFIADGYLKGKVGFHSKLFLVEDTQAIHIKIKEKGKMRVVALISGGKDSCFNMMQCIAAGHEIVAVANLYPVEKGVEI